MNRIDGNQQGIVLVTGGDGRLKGTLTDGDLRRAILGGSGLDDPVGPLVRQKSAASVTAPSGTRAAQLLGLMKERSVRQIPLLDEEGRVTDLATLDELMPDEILPLQAVIMAGGKGSRLHPLTQETPKPMLEVGGRPVMERTVEQLRNAGISRVNVTTHFQPEKIKEHFGDGQRFGVDIRYVSEDRPLGTAGALALMDDVDEPLLVINGDILTRVDFRTMLAFHREHRADFTMAVRRYDLRVPYGVVECDAWRVKGVREKPWLDFFVNAGIYLIEPSVGRFIPKGERLDMTDLIETLVAEGRPVASFPVVEYWLDMGEMGDYERAQQDVEEGKLAT